MRLVVAALAATLVALSANRALRDHIKVPHALVWLVPLIEETAKSGSAVFFGTSIPAVHVLFGLAESAHDILGFKARDVVAALLSILGHTFFGLIAYSVSETTGYLVWGIIASGVVHIGWNWIALRGHSA
ncbi:MAG: hypothetical protein ACOZCF_08840 [Bacillota bacterium]